MRRKTECQVNHFTRVISIYFCSLFQHAISTQTRASISHWFSSFLFGTVILVCFFFNDIVHSTAKKKTEFNAFHEMGERAKMYYAVKILCILVLNSRWFFFLLAVLRSSAYVMASKKKNCLPSEKWEKNNISETHHLCRWCWASYCSVFTYISFFFSFCRFSHFDLTGWNISKD